MLRHHLFSIKSSSRIVNVSLSVFHSVNICLNHAQDDAKNGSRFSRKNTAISSERKLLLSLAPFIWLAWKHCYGTAILIWMPKHWSILGMNIVLLVFFRMQENFTKCFSSSMFIHWKHTNEPKDILLGLKCLFLSLLNTLILGQTFIFVKNTKILPDYRGLKVDLENILTG